jgi:hypothetical protein
VSKLSPHEDNSLNLLRLAVMGLAGYYLLKAYKKEGSLLGATGKIKSINVDTDRIVDSVTPWMKIPDEQKRIVSDGLKEFARNFKNEFNKR